MEKKNIFRYDDLDILKGIGIVFMIMGHIGFGFIFDKYIHGFHMPMFFIISGFLYREKNNIRTSNIIIKRAKKLLTPYIIFGLLQYIIWVILNINSNQKLEVLKNLVWINTNKLMPIAGALWFLTCIFFVDVIFLCMKRYIKKECIMYIMIMIISLLGTYFTRIFSFRLPLAMDVAFTGVGLYFIGYMINKYKDTVLILNVLNCKWHINFIAFNIVFVLTMLNGYINLREGLYGITPLFWINAVVMTLCLWNVARYINNSKYRFIKNTLKFIGKNSMMYLCLNQLVILFSNMLFDDLNIATGISVMVINIIILVISLIILYVCTVFVKNRKIGIVIGV